MKHHSELKQRLAQQWQNAELRVKRLLSAAEWPLTLPIGIPPASLLLEQPAVLRDHINHWKAVTVGQVEWADKAYRDTSAPISVPAYWVLAKPSDWIAACDTPEIDREYLQMAHIIEAIDPLFHEIVLRQRNQVMSRPADEVILAAKIAQTLAPGSARGRPLRALSVAGCDSKFFERHRHLLTRMLSARFGDSVQDLGLEVFLDAADDSDHWLLLASLDKGLLPFAQQRVRARELSTRPLPASQIIFIENEKCLYQLPSLPNTIAILGAGLNLKWLSAAWLQKKRVGYWGDIDTWGLSMLAAARLALPHLDPILMDRETFDRYGPQSAVVEAETAGELTPVGLNAEETALYQFLLTLEKGRLEQEFLPVEWVCDCVNDWSNTWGKTTT